MYGPIGLQYILLPVLTPTFVYMSLRKYIYGVFLITIMKDKVLLDH
jgi:hypothetical protein